MMMIIPKAFFITAAVAILIFSMTGTSYQQVQLLFDDSEEEDAVEEEEDAVEEEEDAVEEEEDAVEEEEEACIEYETEENTIAINCDASFLDVVQTINDPDILENVGEGEYILNANLEVADGVTFAMTSKIGRAHV